jgi:hypothetical protein
MRFKLIATCALLACGVICAAAAGAGARSGGKIFIHATSGEGPAGTIVIVGAIGDHGKTLSMTKSGKPSNNGNFVRITLQKGSFMVDSTKLNAAGNTNRPTINNLATCSFMANITAPVRFFNGTGLYAGISGTATITVSFGGVSPFYKSGPHQGLCNTHTAPLAQWGSVTGPGSVSFS